MSPRRAITSDPEPPRTRAPRTQLTAPELEIAEGVRTAYDGASTQRRRLRVLEEYVAHYTHIAFHPDSWLVPLWISWRALDHDALSPEERKSSREARLGLQAIQRGIVEPTSGYVGGWVSGPRRHRELQDNAAANARSALRQASQDPHIKAAYRDWREGRRDPEYQRYLTVIGERAWHLLVGFDPAAPPPSPGDLHPVVAEAQLRTWSTRRAVFDEWIPVFLDDIRARGLSRALSALAARVHRVPERSLH